ncbi:MAG: hypothetical protein AAF715_04770 [Myxococcota bacterium]
MSKRVFSCGRSWAAVAGSLALVVTLLIPARSAAEPRATLLRIDPRASLVDGSPVLTTVIDLVQHKSMSGVTSRCATFSGNDSYRCMANALEKPQALYDTFKFPEDDVIFTVTVDDRDNPAELVSVDRWGESKKDEGVGTAYLIVIDAGSVMGNRLTDAQKVALEFVNRMGPNDIVNVIFFNDRSALEPSGWKDKKAEAGAHIKSVRPNQFPRGGRARPLFNMIKTAATDGFRSLGNVGSKVDVPMHQAMVVLSSGHSGSDVGSASQGALALADYLTKGRFPENNETMPKAPVPIVSVWFPARAQEEFFENAEQFMMNLANPGIGGFYSIVLEGEGNRAKNIVTAVTRRFDQMFIAKWRVPCIAPTVGQTFKLVFKVDPPVAGDNFINVPVGIDPSTWPLDIDIDRTEDWAADNKLHPNGTLKVFGNFCWGSDEGRAEVYLIPKNQPAPESLKGRSVDEAKKLQQNLIASNLVGKAVNASDQFVEFELPDSTKFLDGKEDDMEARVVVVDKRTYRTSAITADQILTLPAQKEPMNLILIGGLTFAGVVLVLLVIQIFRGGGSGGRRSRRGGGGGGGTTPRPVVAGGHQPRPPGGYGR